MELIIVSGRSGSGKSIVLRALEDLGYNCTDNLPISLLPEYMDLFKHHEQIAIGIDARNMPSKLLTFNDIIIEYKKAGKKITIIYLDADDTILIKRFSETRRRHPLTSATITLQEAIAIETILLKPIADLADITLHTNNMSSHQLQSSIIEQISSHKKGELSLLVLSFGYKRGIPTEADYVFDTRCLPNPYWIPELRELTGQDQKVIDYLSEQNIVDQMYQSIISFTEQWLPKIKSSHRSYLTIALGCTGGQHRSVFLAERIGHYYQNTYTTLIRHRELQSNS